MLRVFYSTTTAPDLSYSFYIHCNANDIIPGSGPSIITLPKPLRNYLFLGYMHIYTHNDMYMHKCTLGMLSLKSLR